MTWDVNKSRQLSNDGVHRCPGSGQPTEGGRCSVCRMDVRNRRDNLAALHEMPVWLRGKMAAGSVSPGGRGAE